jgi:hypothetical protein
MELEVCVGTGFPSREAEVDPILCMDTNRKKKKKKNRTDFLVRGNSNLPFSDSLVEHSLSLSPDLASSGSCHEDGLCSLTALLHLSSSRVLTSQSLSLDHLRQC